MLDRRDDPPNALKNLHRCNAIQDIGGNMENFTFWYVTLPPASQAAEAASFDKSWKNNIAVLTSPGVGLGHQKAIAVLDDRVARGLTRGKRENLIEAWTASHNPKVLAASIPAKPPESDPAALAVKTTSAANAPAAAVAAVKVVPAPPQHAKRQAPVQRYVRSHRTYASSSPGSEREAVDFAQPADLAAAPTAYVPAYAPGPFYAPSAPQPAYYAPAVPPSPTEQPATQPAAQPAYYLAVPPVIEAPLRAAGQALQQIDQGVQSVTHALIGRP